MMQDTEAKKEEKEILLKSASKGVSTGTGPVVRAFLKEMVEDNKEGMMDNKVRVSSKRKALWGSFEDKLEVGKSMVVGHRLHRHKWLPASGNTFVVGGVGAGVITIPDDVDFENVKKNMEVVMLKMAEAEVVGPESGGREGAVVCGVVRPIGSSVDQVDVAKQKCLREGYEKERVVAEMELCHVKGDLDWVMKEGLVDKVFECKDFVMRVKRFQSVYLAAEEEAERRSLKEELMSGATNLEEVNLVMVI
ncbi:hypothetical protein L1887_37949 [Cichorium endivia]|nr:hypothetical protein L1887_37949 [Cichorium endivia]